MSRLFAAFMDELVKLAEMETRELSAPEKVLHTVAATPLGLGGLSDKSGTKDRVAQSLVSEYNKKHPGSKPRKLSTSNPYSMAKKLSRIDLSSGERVKRLALGPFGAKRTADEAIDKLRGATADLTEPDREEVLDRAKAHAAADVGLKALILPALITGVAGKRYALRQSARRASPITASAKAEVIRNAAKLSVLGGGWLGRGLRRVGPKDSA